jgi:hypothetical protein
MRWHQDEDRNSLSRAAAQAFVIIPMLTVWSSSPQPVWSNLRSHRRCDVFPIARLPPLFTTLIRATNFGKNPILKLRQSSYVEMIDSTDQQWYKSLTKDCDQVCGFSRLDHQHEEINS